MKWLSVFLIVAITLNVALGKNLRQKRQANADRNEYVLDNKYGYDNTNKLNRPSSRWIWSSPERNEQFEPNLDSNQWPWINQEENKRAGHKGTQRPQPTQTTTTPRPNRNRSTTQSSAVKECTRKCAVTSEYNPVCGTNLVQYTNIGRLNCANFCGVNVSLLRLSRCPVTTTEAPTR